MEDREWKTLIGILLSKCNSFLIIIIFRAYVIREMQHKFSTNSYGKFSSAFQNTPRLISQIIKPNSFLWNRPLNIVASICQLGRARCLNAVMNGEICEILTNPARSCYVTMLKRVWSVCLLMHKAKSFMNKCLISYESNIGCFIIIYLYIIIKQL